jgi:hypothetical protein
MPFLRFSRDKRGYESFALVQPTNRRGKPGSQVIYAFRSPPNVKVGRQPFDEATRAALEAHYPDLTFDWVKLAAAPLPPAEPERWRERRNAERAAKLAAQVESRVESGDAQPDDSAVSVDVPPSEPVAVEAVTSTLEVETPSSETLGQSARRRRRRRRGRRGRQEVQGAQVQEVQEVQRVADREVQGLREVPDVQEIQTPPDGREAPDRREAPIASDEPPQAAGLEPH